MNRLILFRHAKSDWDAPYGSDHDRPLAPRGIAAARTMGELIARCGEVPDHVITSSAVRAVTTLELAREAGNWECGVTVTNDLYGTSPQGALAVAERAAPEVERLMLVGHEPTWSMLAHELTGGRIVVKTATIVGIDVTTGTWRELRRAAGSTVYVLQPRMFGKR